MNLKNILINKNVAIKDAMRAIDRGAFGIAVVAEENKKLLGIVTDSDVRRAILKGVNVEEKVANIMNTNPLFIKNISEVKSLKVENMVSGCMRIPIVDEKGRIKDIISVFRDGKVSKKKERAVNSVLVIGGAGYLGSILCKKLLDEGYTVKAMDRLLFGPSGIEGLRKNKKFTFLKGDIRNVSDIIRAIRDVDTVIHLAAIVGDPACDKDPKETLEVNYFATKNIIEVCKYFQINRFIFASTCSVYGQNKNPNEKLDEKSEITPGSLYAESKWKCEMAIAEAVDENFSPTILRMGTLYGYSPNMRFDLSINVLTAKAILDREITILNGEQWRPFLHLEDAVEAYLKCLEAPFERIKGKTFNVVSENYKIIDVARIIKSIIPKSEIKIIKGERDKRDYNASFEKISKELGFKPLFKIQDGVSEIKNAFDNKLLNNYKNKKYRT